MSSDTPTRIEAVFDTSPLILLDCLSYTALLPRLYHVFILPQVAVELAAKPGDPGSQLPKEPWVEQQAPDRATLTKVRAELAADPGEEGLLPWR
jgi:hypothetical protein